MGDLNPRHEMTLTWETFWQVRLLINTGNKVSKVLEIVSLEKVRAYATSAGAETLRKVRL